MKQLQISLHKDSLPGQEQLELLEFLASSLQNGFSIAKSFKMLPILWPKRAGLFKRIDRELAGGKSFAECMGELGYSKTTVTQLNIALTQGNLQESLAQLTQLRRMQRRQLKKLESELAYPVVLVVMMIILLVFMQNFVSVQFAESGDHTGDLLIFALVAFFVLLLTSLLLVLGYLQKQDYQSFKKLSQLPFVGAAISSYGQYLISYDLGMLLASGFSLQKMCLFASQQTPGSLQQELGSRVARQLESGKSLQEIILQEPFLNQNLLILLKTGSDRKELSQQCLLIAKMLFDRLTQQVERMIVNIQPFCFILIGLAIIGMYLKLLLPIYGSMQGL